MGAKTLRDIILDGDSYRKSNLVKPQICSLHGILGFGLIRLTGGDSNESCSIEQNRILNKYLGVKCAKYTILCMHEKEG